MALTTDQITTDYPLPAYNYRVDIGATTVAFSEVSGLEIAADSITYNESQVAPGLTGPNTMSMPGIRHLVNLTMKKGLVKTKSISVLYNWMAAIQLNKVEKKDITIHLCDEKGASVITWIIRNAYPTKLAAPTFSASANEVAIESMDLTADSLQMSEP
jgi:phage tail-like protein